MRNSRPLGVGSALALAVVLLFGCSPSGTPTASPSSAQPTTATSTKASPTPNLQLTLPPATCPPAEPTLPGRDTYGTQAVKYGEDGITVQIDYHCLVAGYRIFAYDYNFDEPSKMTRDDNESAPGLSPAVSTTAQFTFTDKPVGEPGDDNEHVEVMFIVADSHCANDLANAGNTISWPPASCPPPRDDFVMHLLVWKYPSK
jgi:hypothetical protein